jgi:hypothetical protein
MDTRCGSHRERWKSVRRFRKPLSVDLLFAMTRTSQAVTSLIKEVPFRPIHSHTTGVFFDNAQHLINRPPTSDEVLSKRFAVTVQDALSSGLTSIHDAGLDPSSLGFFKR